jgi:hypothetical protein
MLNLKVPEGGGCGLFEILSLAFDWVEDKTNSRALPRRHIGL